MGDSRGQCRSIFRGNNKASDPIFYGFCISSDVGCDDREGGCHGLDNGIGEAFAARGKDEDVGRREMLVHIGNAANEMEMICEGRDL